MTSPVDGSGEPILQPDSVGISESESGEAVDDAADALADVTNEDAEEVSDEDDREGDDREGDDGEADDGEAEEKPWWDNPAFPWRGEPTKADFRCMWAIGAMGIFNLIQLPFRPVLLTLNPYALAALGGGSISMATIGARFGTGLDPWFFAVFGLVLGALSVIKFDWIFWWAGRLWGDGLIDYLLQNRGAGFRKRADRAKALAQRFDILALGLTYVPLLPIPAAIIYGALGISGTKLRRFLAIDITFALLSRAIYMYLGYRIGQPAIDALNEFGKYANYVSIGLIVVVIFLAFWRSNKKPPAQ